eukprot:Gb_18939 [translate_table: standard]
MYLMQPPNKLFLQRIKSHIQSLQLLSCIYIIHEQTVIELKAISSSILNHLEQFFIALGVNGSGLQIQFPQHPTHSMSNKLALCGMSIVLCTRHLHHPTTLSRKDVQKPITALSSQPSSDSNPLINKRKASPPSLPTLRTKHWMSAQNIKLSGQYFQKQLPRKLLHRQNICKQRASL